MNPETLQENPVDTGTKTSAGTETAAQTYNRIQASRNQPTDSPSVAGTNTSGFDSLKDMSIANSPKTAGTIKRSIKDTAPEMPNFYKDAYSDAERDAQRQINLMNKYADEQLESMKPRQEERLSETNAVNTLTGLAGSTEANRTTEKTTAVNKQENDLIRAEAAAKAASIMGQISTKALNKATFDRENFFLDAETQAANRTARIQEDVDNITFLSQSGATADGLKAMDPEGYDYLVESLGSEEMVKAHFALNRPKESIMDARVEGGKYVIAYENPVDGKVRIESVDLGLPTGYSKTIDAGNRIIAMPDDWDGDPAKLVTINKGLTPGQAAAGSGSGSGGGGGQYTSDLDAIIGATISTIGSKYGQETFETQLARARNDADRISLVAAQVLKGAPAAIKTDFTNQTVGIRELDKAIARIDEGVQTGAIEAGAQYLYNVVGKDFDPALAEINQSIIAAIQPYRNSVTGAAWGTQEDGEYQQLFGSTRYSPKELRQRLVGVREILKSKSAQGLGSYVNPLGYYDNPFASGDFSPGGSIEDRVDAAGLDYQAMLADGFTPAQIEDALTNF